LINSVLKTMCGFSVGLVSSVAALSAAHAGVITVVIDNFDGTSLAAPGASVINVIENPLSAPIVAAPSGGEFFIDLGPKVLGEVRLNYGSVALPFGYTSAKITYNVPFSALGTDPLTGAGGSNEIGLIGGTAGLFGFLPNASNGQPGGSSGSSGFTGGNITLLFRTANTRAWDLSIDNLTLTITCDSLATDIKYDVTGTAAKPVSGLDAYSKAIPSSCIKSSVPLPASASLMVLGLLGFALSRKR
jgi:hypothetical protein